MENIENIKEDIEVGIDAVTVTIPVRVTMTSINNAPFEFTVSIDEVGQIILTPNSKEVEFIDANTDDTVEYDIPVAEQETVTTVEGNLETKETSIIINASMLAEDDNHMVSAVVDEIGQVVIYPMADKNTFVTASFEQSLNLVTEEMRTVEYFGYTLINTGDGWDIKDYSGEVVETGVATEAEAKIAVLTTEMHRLEDLTEEVEEQSEDEIDEPEDDKEEKIPEVTAEVINEEVVDATQKVNEFDRQQIEKALDEITDSFKETEGAVRCDTKREQSECFKILQLHYSSVRGDNENDKFIVTFNTPIEETNAPEATVEA